LTTQRLAAWFGQSFDQLVCAAGQRQWDGDAKHVGGLGLTVPGSLLAIADEVIE
jgi:hypothetical protein